MTDIIDEQYDNEFSLTIAEVLFSSEDQFPVDFDDAWQWLGYSRKDNGKTAFLKCGFIENIDYVSLKVQENSEGRPRETFNLSCECLKQWGMMAGTEQGKRVRLYFLECEKIAKSKMITKPKTTTELLLESVQQLVEFEKKQKELEANQKLLESKLEAQIEKMEAHETWLTGIDAELDRLESPQGHYFSVVGYANLNKVKIGKLLANSLGKKCSAWCRKNGMRKEMVNDTLYGEIGSYPTECLEYVFLNEGLITKSNSEDTEFEFEFE